MKQNLPFLLAALLFSCGGGTAPTLVAPPPPVVSTPSPSPVPTPPIATGAIALLSASLPDGSTVVTQPLGSQGQAAPTLTFRYAVRLDSASSGLLIQIWVRTDEARCMGTGIAAVDFKAGEQKIFQSSSVSYQQGTDPAPCRLPYTTNAVEVTVSRNGVILFLDRFPMTYNFRQAGMHST